MCPCPPSLRPPRIYAPDFAHRSYSWSPDTPDPDHKFPGIEFMPQLWGPNQVSDFENVVKAGYAKIILGMNECVSRV